jgi:hypothetical protein
MTSWKLNEEITVQQPERLDPCKTEAKKEFLLSAETQYLPEIPGT